MLIESGRLPATRPSGRWLVEQRHLAAVATQVEECEPAARPHVQGGRPIGADPVAPIVEIHATQSDEAEEEAPSDLLAHLEQATAKITDLRMERDALRLRLREQVSSLQRSLEDAIEELDAARARVAELEARSHDEPTREAGTGARAALTPLFQATTLPPQRKQ